MPLIRLDMVRGRSPETKRRIADVCHGVMRDVFAAPEGDRYQIITEHEVGDIIAEDTGLGLERSSEGVLIVSVTQQGRSLAQKEAMYRALAERLDEAGLVRPEDLIVSVSANTLEDWSFGSGRAQFLTGELGRGDDDGPRADDPPAHSEKMS
ncbi:tautomerase family protein [Brachybacterium huguangmaarense]|uniref:Tautomerase family protein n=1 Tax=Brachybacterium huguangmaarense TaxID=1652028 RepID=A0ABY6G2W0_9MICO|nr:tautomerase family protein [Brachybacterium huguangmaarense]UYG17534.1 tautomerase family protein [Brachybacterium huguangmaarense]